MVTPTDMREFGAAVLRRAIMDLSHSAPCEVCERPVKDCARDFLTAATDEDREKLEFWCAVAGRDHEDVIRWTLREHPSEGN